MALKVNWDRLRHMPTRWKVLFGAQTVFVLSTLAVRIQLQRLDSAEQAVASDSSTDSKHAVGANASKASARIS